MVKPVDPFQVANSTASTIARVRVEDHLGLVKTVDGFSQGVDAPISVKGHLLRQRQSLTGCGDSRRFLVRRIA